MITRRSLLTRLGAVGLAGAGAWLLRDRILWPRPSAAFAGGATSSGWLDVPGDISIVTVAALVKGRPVRALIDSGAQRSVIDKAFADTLGLAPALGPPVLAIGLNGQPQFGRSANLSLRLGDLTLEDLRAAVLDLSPLADIADERIPLVIGQDVLSALVLDLDLPRARLAFHAPATAPAGAAALPARTVGRALHVPVTVEGHPLEAVLDTGSSSTLALSEASARAAGLLDPGRPVRFTPSITLGGSSMDREVTAETLSFGGRTFRKAPVAIYGASGTAAAMLPPGLLGVGALRNERVHIDLGGGRLSLAAA